MPGRIGESRNERLTLECDHPHLLWEGKDASGYRFPKGTMNIFRGRAQTRVSPGHAIFFGRRNRVARGPATGTRPIQPRPPG